MVINSHIFLKIFTPIFFLGRIHIPILTYAYIFQKGVGEFNHQLVPQWVGRPKCAHGLTVGIPNLGVSTGLGPSHEEGTTLVVEGKYGMTSLPSFFLGVIINHEKGSLLTNQDSMESRSFFFFFWWLTYQIGGFTNFSWNTVGRNPAPVEVGRLSHYLQGFIHPRWCRISFLQQYDGISSSHHMKIHHSMPWNRKHVRSIAPLLFHYWGQRLLRYIQIFIFIYCR